MIQTRFALVKLELREARIYLARFCVLVGLIFIFTLLFIVSSSILVVFFLTRLFSIEIVLLSVSLVFLLLILICVWAVFLMSRRGNFRFLSATRAELKKDYKMLFDKSRENNASS